MVRYSEKENLIELSSDATYTSETTKFFYYINHFSNVIRHRNILFFLFHTGTRISKTKYPYLVLFTIFITLQGLFFFWVPTTCAILKWDFIFIYMLELVVVDHGRSRKSRVIGFFRNLRWFGASTRGQRIRVPLGLRRIQLTSAAKSVFGSWRAHSVV